MSYGSKREIPKEPDALPVSDKRWLDKNTKDLIKALLLVNTAEEMAYFLRDLMTPAELREFGNRWKAARMLAEGKSYNRVIDETNLSSRTVRRIKRWLTEGMGGYELVIRRLNKEEYKRRNP